MEVVVVGAGPAGVFAALRAADLGAHTTLVTRDHFGGMAANDGPVPVRTLAHAARLAREARQLGDYGIVVGEKPHLDFPRLLTRVEAVVAEVGARSALRPQIETAGVTVHENAGAVRFIDPHTVEGAGGRRLTADRFLICTGGVSRRLPLPGFELTCTHSDAWSLTKIPASMLVIGAGATGAQVASVFNALGTKVQVFQSGPRILPTEDEDVSAAMAAAFRKSGIQVHEDFGEIEGFRRSPGGVRMAYAKHGVRQSAEAELIVTAVGWMADTTALNLPAAGVALDDRGFVQVDTYLRTSAPHIFAAGDVTGGLLLAPQAMRAGFLAASNAVEGALRTAADHVTPVGSFTDPEYAQVGFTESQAKASGYDVLTTRFDYADAARPIIDGRTEGFCKLIIDRADGRILGCHVIGERAVDLVQLAALAMTAGMTIQALAKTPFSFPTHAGVLGRAALSAVYALNRDADRPTDPVYVH
jgi:dihydrolipoamide dehydrogenase